MAVRVRLRGPRTGRLIEIEGGGAPGTPGTVPIFPARKVSGETEDPLMTLRIKSIPSSPPGRGSSLGHLAATG